MTTNRFQIRAETPEDIEAITELTAEAFATLEISDHTEQYVITALRSAGALAISLVAEVDGRVVGHIAFSPVTIADGTTGWYGLGPVSVLPEFQRVGNWHSANNRRPFTSQSKGCQGLLPGRSPAVLQQIWL